MGTSSVTVRGPLRLSSCQNGTSGRRPPRPLHVRPLAAPAKVVICRGRRASGRCRTWAAWASPPANRRTNGAGRRRPGPATREAPEGSHPPSIARSACGSAASQATPDTTRGAGWFTKSSFQGHHASSDSRAAATARTAPPPPGATAAPLRTEAEPKREAHARRTSGAGCVFQWRAAKGPRRNPTPAALRRPPGPQGSSSRECDSAGRRPPPEPTPRQCPAWAMRQRAAEPSATRTTIWISCGATCRALTVCRSASNRNLRRSS